jgi:hypothetical protein
LKFVLATIYYYGSQIKYDEVCGTHNSYERGQETYREFKYKSLEGREYLRDVGIEGRIILK